jgi:hypothetical protein
VPCQMPSKPKVNRVPSSTGSNPIPDEQITQYVTATGVPAITSLTTWWYESIVTA